MALHPHLIVGSKSEAASFTSPSSGPRTTFNRPDRNRAAHAQSLIGKIEAIEPIAAELVEAQRADGIQEGNGIYLTFESEPIFPLKFESLDLAASGIELCTVKTLQDGRSQATVYVPDGKLERFLHRVQDYRDKDTKPRKEGGLIRPTNQDLVESIADIRLAALEALWAEEGVPFPEGDETRTWEVWLRKSDAIDHLQRLKYNAARFSLVVGEQFIAFVDRVVVHVRAKASDLSRSAEILGMIAELHSPRVTAAFFTDMDGKEQAEWMEELAGRIQEPAETSPYVCLFDTGLSLPHSLLAKVADPADRHSYKPSWGVNDTMNHGTPMAGLAALGDLTDLLAGSQPIASTHRIESVKIFHQPDPQAPELYGAVTAESTYRVEVIPGRRRVHCMAVTTPEGRGRGKPSSWSAAVDSLASGADDGQRRLFILSAGNTDPAQRRNYPDSNLTDGIHDPAQAWNALTVGGYTQKSLIDAVLHPGWSPLAGPGDLSPCSCTSTTWGRWPVKPDIVMEAGNMGTNPALPDPDYIDDGLMLLSTGRNSMAGKPLTTFRDTSAAAALAARLAGSVWAKYPTLWPETVRALLVHAARWTPAMEARFQAGDGSVDYRSLLRCFGFGVPNERRLMSSLDNSLTLLVEGEIQPFYKDEKDKRIKTRELRLHALPWPTDVLRGLGNAPVTMRVTLSYFVEPSPGERGWTARYGYQSHGLRFAVKKPLETAPQFQQRINKAEREDDYVAPGLSDGGWRFGSRERGLTTLGSLHSDIWEGRAVELAERGMIAVYPALGWWNRRQRLGSFDRATRYSLVVTIETPGSEIDIYTPVAAEIGVPVEIEIER